MGIQCCCHSKWFMLLIVAAAAAWLTGSTVNFFGSKASSTTGEKMPMSHVDDQTDTQLATFGAGCFWCVEAVFDQLDGVVSVESGYSGGTVADPTYAQICRGTTGHAEVCQIRFDPKTISYDQLLEVFWQTHDPTTLNRQGADVGTQYRSVIFPHSDEQKQLALEYLEKLDRSGAFRAPIVTTIEPYTKFYKAEVEHQLYYERNPNSGYCRAVIKPKLDKFKKVFADRLKQNSATTAGRER